MNKKEKVFIYLCFLITLYCALKVGSIAVYGTPEYTGVKELIQDVGVAGWVTDIDSGTAPSNSVACIIASNSLTSGAGQLNGVRDTDENVTKSLSLNEAEGGGTTSTRYLINVDSSGNVDLYRNANTQYHLVGYWVGVEFTDQWVSYQTDTTTLWTETDGSDLALVADRVHLITLQLVNQGTQHTIGVRNTTSSLVRRTSIMESEGGGSQTTSVYVKADADAKIDTSTSDKVNTYFINQGYFNASIDFKEDYSQTVSGGGAWLDYDMFTNKGVPKDATIDFIVHSYTPSAVRTIGVRENGDGTDRRFSIREAEAGGSTGYGMTSESDIDGVVEIYGQYQELYVYTGHFLFVIPYAPTIVAPTLLYGVGYNHTVPHVIIRWNHTVGEVDNYEIIHSTDNITYTHLAYTPNTNYTHTPLTNGTYHFYRVRSTLFNVSWWNSSYTPINLERVHFILAVGSVNITLVGGDWYEYNVSSITVVKGAYDSGNLASMNVDDLDYYVVDEVIGVEGFDIRTNFTNIPLDILSLSFRALTLYHGNPAHVVAMEVFNHSSNAWLDLNHIAIQDTFVWTNHSLSIGRGINNGGNVWCRIVHYTSGVGTHYEQLDYIKLRGFIAIPSTGGGIIWWLGILFISIPLLLVLLKVLRK